MWEQLRNNLDKSQFKSRTQNRQITMVTDEASAFLLSIQTKLNVTKLTFAPGVIHLPNGTKVSLGKILCDMGALHGSYISMDFLNRHLKSVEHLSKSSKEVVVLADRLCRKHIRCSVPLSLTVFDNEENPYDFSTSFNVMDNLGQDMIIDLPVLAISLQKFFIKKLSYHIDASIKENDKVWMFGLEMDMSQM